MGSNSPLSSIFATSLPLSNPDPQDILEVKSWGGGHEFWPDAQGDGNAWN